MQNRYSITLKSFLKDKKFNNKSFIISANDNLVLDNDNIKVIKCLKNCGLNINVIDDINSTPLIYAILYNKQNSIKYLVENGADLEHEDFLGHTATNLAYSLKIKI